MSANISLRRVKRDLAAVMKEPLPGIYVTTKEDDISEVHALIIGPVDTPYQGGFFHFVLSHGPQYPHIPPTVKNQTTGGGTVRFNPNLYKIGRVCASILGTTEGPSWTPACNLTSVLTTVHSLMSERPYHNMPGYEDKERQTGDSIRYNAVVDHETICIAVIQNLEMPSLPGELQKIMLQKFMENYDYYVGICERKIDKDQQPTEYPFGPGECCDKFQYKSLLAKLATLKNKIDEGLDIFERTASACSS